MFGTNNYNSLHTHVDAVVVHNVSEFLNMHPISKHTIEHVTLPGTDHRFHEIVLTAKGHDCYDLVKTRPRAHNRLKPPRPI